MTECPNKNQNQVMNNDTGIQNPRIKETLVSESGGHCQNGI